MSFPPLQFGISTAFWRFGLSLEVWHTRNGDTVSMGYIDGF